MGPKNVFQFSVLLLISVSFLFVAGCGGSKEKEEQWVIGMSQCNKSEPWRGQMNRDITAAIGEHSGELRVIFKDANGNSATQQAQVREFIDMGVDLIIISPLEAKPLTTPVADAMEEDIPVIVLDRKIEGDNYTAFIGPDNTKIGREVGKYLVEKLGGKGNIVELKGLMTSTPAQGRHNGFLEVIEDYPDMKVVFEADMEWQEEKAQAEMSSALAALSAKGTKIDAVYGHNDPGAHGAYTVVKRDEEVDESEIVFVGIDALAYEGIKYVKDGMLSATFEYPTGGSLAVETALKILKGQKFDKNTNIGRTRLYTKDNVDSGGLVLE